MYERLPSDKSQPVVASLNSYWKQTPMRFPSNANSSLMRRYSVSWLHHPSRLSHPARLAGDHPPRRGKTIAKHEKDDEKWVLTWQTRRACMGLHGLAFSHFSRRKLTMASLPWKKISRFLQMQSYKRFAQGPTSLSVRMLRVHAINLENRLVCQAKKVQRNLISSYPTHSGPFLSSVYAKLTFSGSRVFQASSAIWTFFSASATLVKGGRGGRTNLSPRHE